MRLADQLARCAERLPGAAAVARARDLRPPDAEQLRLLEEACVEGFIDQIAVLCSLDTNATVPGRGAQTALTAAVHKGRCRCTSFFCLAVQF